MEPPTPKTYRAQEFARLAGVTVRALHHYDRIGLLTPRRTGAGYRVYVADDLARLEQIVALKFIGIPLKHIRQLATATPGALVHALRAQRQTLEDKRGLLDHAIQVIGELEAVVRAGLVVDPALYRRIIEVIEMQNDSDAWKQKYEALAQAKIERLRSLSPDALAGLRAEWAALITDIQSVVADDPASARAQALGKRWTDLLARLMGTPVDVAALGRHQRAQEWTPQMATFVDKPVWDFMTRVLAAIP